MDIFDFFFKQTVTQGQLDFAFNRVQMADHSLALDNDITGIVEALDCQQHAPVPDKNIDIVGPGQAYDQEGQRIAVDDALTVLDCSQDEYGTDSNPPTPLFERYISVFVRFNRDLTEPMLDGNSITVYTKQLEDFEFFVRLGAEAAAGLAVPAPLMTDALLVCDILVVNGFVAILNADFDLTRREDWTRFVGAVIGTRVYGTSQEAVADILALIEAWGTALPFTFTDVWFGPVAVAGSAPPPATIQTALDAIVYDLAQTGAVTAGSPLVGALDSGAFPGGFVTPWVNASIDLALISLGTDLDAHIGGAPPAHPAAAIVFTPYLWLASVDVQAALQEVVDDLALGTGDTRIGTQAIGGAPEAWGGGTLNALATAIYGHMNDRTERAANETVSGDWVHTGEFAATDVVEMTGPYQTMKSRFGGGMSPEATVADACARKTWGTRKTWSQMWESANSHTCAASPLDLCCAPFGRDMYVLAMVPGNLTVEIIDTRDPTVTDVADISTAGAPLPTAICCDGATVFVMFNNDTVSAWTFGPTPGGGAWTPRWGPIALPGGASGSFDRIAVVTDTYIMTANSGLNSNVGNCFTRLQRTDGLGALSGIGSMVVNVNNFPRGGLASYGTTVYATTLDSLTPANAELVEIDPATMGNPGHFAGANPGGGAATNDWRDIVCDGSLIWIVESKIAPGLVHVYPAEAAVGSYQANEFAWAANYYGRFLVFDGFNIWCTKHTTALGTPNGTELQGIPVCEATWVGGGKAATGIIARQTQPWTDIAAPDPGKMTFDGDAVWVIQDRGAYPNVICRLPHAPDRC